MPKKKVPMQSAHSSQDTDKKKRTTTLPLERKRASDFKVIYANSVQVSPTRWDVQFIFEQIIAPPAGTQPSTLQAEQQIAVIMSPEHAKSFCELLQRQVQKIS